MIKRDMFFNKTVLQTSYAIFIEKEAEKVSFDFNSWQAFEFSAFVGAVIGSIQT